MSLVRGQLTSRDLPLWGVLSNIKGQVNVLERNTAERVDAGVLISSYEHGVTKRTHIRMVVCFKSLFAMCACSGFGGTGTS